MNKILVSCPTAKSKNYCFIEWLENSMLFKYPNYEIVVFDNTPDEGENTQFLNDTFNRLYGKSTKFKAIHANIKGVSSLIERMAIASNEMRDYFIKGDYTHLLSLESDVFPEHSIIEDLMIHGKMVVGALYYRDMGRWRKLTIQHQVKRSPYYNVSFNMAAGEETFFIDGTLKKVASVGLGCVLISRPVLEKIKFRYLEGQDLHPDTLWSEDVYLNGWIILADTSLIARHFNTEWGVFGKDYK